MAKVTLPGVGLMFPTYRDLTRGDDATNLTAGTIDATGEKIAYCGRVFIDGRPASAKTLSSSGGKIHFRTGAVTFANGGTTVDIGIQDIDATVGPGPRPDGTFDVKTTLTGGVDTLSANSWITLAMATGSKSIAHGDYICIVFDMTARAGSDSIVVQGIQRRIGGIPFTNTFTGGAWSIDGANTIGTCLIEFDDGTLATLMGVIPGALGADLFGDTSNPDERGLLFRLPWDVDIEALWHAFGSNGQSTPDGTLTLYEDPLGTPSALETFPLTAEADINGVAFLPLDVAVSLARDTDYCLAMKGTATAGVRMPRFQFANAAYRRFISNGLNLRLGSRNNLSGAFTEDATIIPVMGVVISAFDDGAGAGGGSGNPIGMIGAL
ncbi:MAG: hypothetical protein ACM31O_14095 [Bacteroidota bacterium]